MSQWQQQIIDNANAIQQLIANAKKISELNALSVSLEPNDKFAVELALTGETVYATIADLNLSIFNPTLGATNKGDIIVYDGAEWVNFSSGTNGFVLSSNSTTPTGLDWIAAPGLQNLDQVLTQGNISTQSARLGKLEIDSANAYLDVIGGVLNVYNAGQMRIRNTVNDTEVYLTSANGVGFRDGGVYYYFKSTNLTQSRTYQVPDASGIIPLSVNGYVANALGQITIPGASFPLTTKGDIYTFSTLEERLPVGTDGYVLSADSLEATGLKWIPNTGGGAVVDDTPYGVSWDGNTDGATKNAIFDKIETLKVKISNYWVDKNGNTDKEAFEVGDYFEGYPTSDRYVVGRVIGLPFDIDDNTKVKKHVDNYEDF
jgi:hypothetical protein